MSTTPEQSFVGRRRRRLHTDAFKADAVAACTRPGVSMAAVAMAHGINANLLRRWVRAAEMKPSVGTSPIASSTPIAPIGVAATSSAPKPSFVPMALPPTPPAQSISIEVRRGTTSVAVTWPATAAAECAIWMRELLR